MSGRTLIDQPWRGPIGPETLLSRDEMDRAQVRARPIERCRPALMESFFKRRSRKKLFRRLRIYSLAEFMLAMAFWRPRLKMQNTPLDT